MSLANAPPFASCVFPPRQNDRKDGTSSQPISYILPKNTPVARLLTWHINVGHNVLAWLEGPHTRLFLDEGGESFDRDNGSAFQNYWDRVFARVNKLLKDQVGCCTLASCILLPSTFI